MLDFDSYTCAMSSSIYDPIQNKTQILYRKTDVYFVVFLRGLFYAHINFKLI